MAETAQEAPAEQLKPGQYIGNYRVVRHIAEGGMGVVFEALHEEIGRRVAIKVLRRDISNNPDIARRFINEARVVIQIQHSGLVQVFDYGRLPDNSAYIVMEFLQGRPLTDRIRNAAGGLAIPDVLRFGRQLAGALAVTHEMGIVHRDLKPDNVMLIADREVIGGERTKILDFGIAKVANGAGAKTRTHAIMGSAPYMAPEQCRGSGEITDRTDVYALGVILFEMVTGRVPFIADEDVEVMTKHIKEAAPAVQTIRKDAPPELASLIRRMLAKGPTDRPAMRDVVELIDSLLPIPGSGTMPVFPKAEIARQRQHKLLMTGGWVALGLVGTIVTISALRRPPPPPAPLPQAPPPAVITPAAVAPAPVRQIRWSIETIPPGAEVIQNSTGELLGRTPWEREQLPSEGMLTLTLRLSGYFKRTVSLNLADSAHITETLKPFELPPLPLKSPGHGKGRQSSP